MAARYSRYHSNFERQNRRARQFRMLSYVLLGLLATATTVVVSYVLNR
ncbi:hypothetical protein ACSVHC_09070 [Arthrobacter sp. KNU-44]